MLFKTVVPILYSTDVSRSLTYYVDVLGFDRRWEWGNPPSFGGVIKDAVEIFFSEKDQGNAGTWISVVVDDIDGYYETIRTKGADIIAAPDTKEWGMREMLVKDPDGHMIRFGQNVSAQTERNKSETLATGDFRIVERAPSALEYRSLATAIGWSSDENSQAEEARLKAARHGWVAEDTVTGNVIGCVLLLSDDTGFYYLKDLMVHSQWQGRYVATAILETLHKWLEKNAPENSAVWLHTAESLASFYKKFGFLPAFGMIKMVNNK